jgi:hypothetical protein
MIQIYDQIYSLLTKVNQKYSLGEYATLLKTLSEFARI